MLKQSYRALNLIEVNEVGEAVKKGSALELLPDRVEDHLWLNFGRYFSNCLSHQAAITNLTQKAVRSLLSQSDRVAMKPLLAAPCIFLLLLRAYRRRSLTPLALLTAGCSATIHAFHPSALPFTLLGTFFLLGTAATKVKHDVKSTLTLNSGGGSGGEGPRTSIQVLANSGCATLLCLFHLCMYGVGTPTPCFGFATSESWLSSLIIVGIIANYVSVTADTLSSELGILSQQQPFLLTNPTERVPKGTNGGVTYGGIMYGFVGSAVIACTSMLFLPFCSDEDRTPSSLKPFFISSNSPSWTLTSKILIFLSLSIWGGLGSLLDSLLGALLQASVVDRRSGKVVEGSGGIKVLTHASKSNSRKGSSSPQKRQPASEKATTLSQESRFIGSGRDLLDNNQINFLMASIMTFGAMLVASAACSVSASNTSL